MKERGKEREREYLFSQIFLILVSYSIQNICICDISISIFLHLFLYPEIELTAKNKYYALALERYCSHRQRTSFSRNGPFPSASSVSSSWCSETFDPEGEGTAEHEEAINITLFQRRVKCPRCGRRTRSEIVAELCIAGAFCERDTPVYAASPHFLVAFELPRRCKQIFRAETTTCYFEPLNLSDVQSTRSVIFNFQI